LWGQGQRGKKKRNNLEKSPTRKKAKVGQTEGGIGGKIGQKAPASKECDQKGRGTGKTGGKRLGFEIQSHPKGEVG